MMRSAYLFPAITAAGLASVASIGHALAAALAPAMTGYVAGVAFTIVASIVVNSCNAARYGRRVWEDQRGDINGLARHADHMRRDRVRRHPEAPATFPAGDAA